MMDNEVLGIRSEMSYSIYKFMWYFLIFMSTRIFFANIPRCWGLVTFVN